MRIPSANSTETVTSPVLLISSLVMQPWCSQTAKNCTVIARKAMTVQKNMVTAQGWIDPNQSIGTSIMCSLTSEIT
uniref:Pectinesterase catalytic domain-containing protein n=1 Tax=Nelumbo nucifera TaxID=4432 RepID=A0A822YMR2_NELNU|nr:TPA_asm: hypothetical protein HUJ06_006104 [Nelumbo nucifera]